MMVLPTNPKFKLPGKDEDDLGPITKVEKAPPGKLKLATTTTNTSIYFFRFVSLKSRTGAETRRCGQNDSKAVKYSWN